MDESTAMNSKERVQNDSELVEELLHKLKCDKVSVATKICLGKCSEEVSARARFIKVVTASEDQKETVLRRTKNLKSMKEGDWHKLFIHQDLIPKQWEARKLLVQELKGRMANGNKGLIILNGKMIKRILRSDEN